MFNFNCKAGLKIVIYLILPMLFLSVSEGQTRTSVKHPEWTNKKGRRRKDECQDKHKSFINTTRRTENDSKRKQTAQTNHCFINVVLFHIVRASV